MYQVNISHIKMEKEFTLLEDCPGQYIIQVFYMKVNSKVYEMLQNEENVPIDNINVIIKKSVYKYICQLDEVNNGREMLEDKFGEYSEYINYNSWHIKNLSISMLKCCYRFNHHSIYTRIFN